MRIDVDFQVFQEITRRRVSEQHSENAVLREVLGLPPAEAQVPSQSPNGDLSRGLSFNNKLLLIDGDPALPNGIELYKQYKGQDYFAKVENGGILYNGVFYDGPEAARKAVTPVNWKGWWFWTVKKADNSGSEYIGSVKDRALGKISHADVKNPPPPPTEQ